MSGDEESNARKAQAFIVLEGKPCCVSHLQYNLQIYWNSYFPYTPLKIWIIWGFLPLSCMSVFLDIKPLSNIWFGISSVNLEIAIWFYWCSFLWSLMWFHLFWQLLPLLLVWNPKPHCKHGWQEDDLSVFF